jgi:type IX secretion system PorP/SprF family membrane protein
MKNKLTKLTAYSIVFLMASAFHKATAQTDPHFTQNYTYPLYLNPALTGSGNGDYRITAIHRSQWGAVGNPYRTTGISADARTNKNVAVGFNLMDQTAGDGGFNYLNTYASVAYTGVKFGKENYQRMVFAMQAGIINRHFDASKFKWGEQWDPITGYNASNPTTESFAKTSATILDIGAGALYYDATPSKKYNVFAGLSFFHINKPADPIISSQSVALNTIPLRYTVHGGVSINLQDGTSIVPHALYMQQGNAHEFMLGAYVQHDVNEETNIMFGGYYRYKDAVAPFVGVDYKDFTVGLSYDVNRATLGASTKNINSFELSLSYVFRQGSKSIFDFIHCPRL